MSFRCELCKKPQKAHTAPIMLVTERRYKVYPERKKGTKVIDKGGKGWEIAKEIRACAKCVKLRNSRLGDSVVGAE